MGKLGLITSNTLLDTLYGGINGELYQPDINYQETDINAQDSSPLPDPKSKPSPQESDLSGSQIEKYEIIPPDEVFAASLEDSEYDIRPRVFDHVSQTFSLVDTGSQVSVLRPVPGDIIQPHIRLETVDGSQMPCYGKKEHSVRFGRKTYHIQAVISNTTDSILGMDFMKKYRLGLDWGPFGDLYLIDKKSDTRTLCQFVKVPKQNV